MKFNWNTIMELVIALAIAFVLNEFVIAPLAEKFMPKITGAFEKILS